MRMSRRMGLLGGKSRVPIGTVWYFTASDEFVVPETGTYSIVAVGGGGGGAGGYGSTLDGGTAFSGGGGGGGSSGCVITASSYLLNGASYTITVGSNGSGVKSGQYGRNREDRISSTF